MADKFTEFLDKAFKPLINFIGNNKIKNENITGIVLGDTEIQICSTKKKGENFIVEQYSYQKIAGIGADQDIFTASTYLSDQIKNALSFVKLKSKDVAVSLPNTVVTTYNLQIPIMDPVELAESVELGGFWEQFDQTPETLEGFETSYQVLSSNEEMGVMDILLFTAETKTIEAYMNIMRLAGVNPVVLDINSNNQFNALVPAFTKEGFEQPVAIFNYSKDNNYVAIASAKGVSILDISIVEADQVLLDTIEDVEDVLNEFWDEIFERVGSQIKQALVEFETQFEAEPINMLNIFSDKKKLSNLSAGLSKHLGEEFVIKEYNPEESVDFNDDAKKYLDSLPSKSMSATAVGASLRKLNAFEINDATDEIFKFNFVPRLSQLKVNRKSTSVGKFFLVTGLIIAFLGLGHVVPFGVLKIIENQDVISKQSADLQDVQQKEELLKAYELKVDGTRKKISEVDILGANKLTTSELVGSLSKAVPLNIRLIEFKIDQKNKISLRGVSKDDASVTQMVENFTKEKIVEEAKLEKFSTALPKDLGELYEGLKKEEYPNEQISKVFKLNVSLTPVEGETFDNEKKLAKLIGKKRR